MDIDLTQIIIALIGLVGIVVSGWLVPFLKSRTTKDHWDMIESWTKMFVKGAEVLYKESGRGEEKKNYVLEELKKKCAENHITFNEDEIKAAIEAVWFDMTKQ